MIEPEKPEPLTQYDDVIDLRKLFRVVWSGKWLIMGITFGATDDFGFHIVENPVHVHDIQATIMHTLGFDHERLTYHLAGRDFRLTDVHGRVVWDLLG